MSEYYCSYAATDPLHAAYHDTEYGFPETDETRLFERLVMEIMQAGLNWSLVLKKRTGMAEALDGYDIDVVAAYGESKRTALLDDARIVRNRLKVNAVIHNAQVIQGMRKSHGGFAHWIAAHHPLQKRDWITLFKKTFKFTGGEITGEFLMSIGYLPGAHAPDCPIASVIDTLNPPWRRVSEDFYMT